MTECQAYSLSTGPAGSGLVGFGIPDAGTSQVATPAMTGSLNQDSTPSTIGTQASNKPRKPRRPKPRIELASDQPPTTQGKPRARVYVACVQWYFARDVSCFQLIRVAAAPVKFVVMAQNLPVIIVIGVQTRNVNMTLFRRGEDQIKLLERVNASSEICQTSWMAPSSSPNDDGHKKSETRMAPRTHLATLPFRISNNRQLSNKVLIRTLQQVDDKTPPTVLCSWPPAWALPLAK